MIGHTYLSPQTRLVLARQPTPPSTAPWTAATAPSPSPPSWPASNSSSASTSSSAPPCSALPPKPRQKLRLALFKALHCSQGGVFLPPTRFHYYPPNQHERTIWPARFISTLHPKMRPVFKTRLRHLPATKHLGSTKNHFLSFAFQQTDRPHEAACLLFCFTALLPARAGHTPRARPVSASGILPARCSG